MCGIFGTIGKNFDKIEDSFLSNLSHRGPEDDGVYKEPGVELLLGQTRLSIIDLSYNGHQPMIDKTKNYIITLNGEIYNYVEIRKELILKGYSFNSNCDTEVVLYSYIEWGENCLNRFRGMFAFCIYDKLKKKLFLARDRFGIKPLIYANLDNQFVFTSELKPILESEYFPKRICLQALSDYFKFGSISQPNTILEGFHQLMPGHYMYVDFNHSYTIHKYYDIVKESKKLDVIDNYNEATKVLRAELENTTKYHLVADVDVGVFLSGGVDSTAVTALMRQQKGSMLNTFSVGFKNQTDVADETSIAARTAKSLGTNHNSILVDNKYIENIFDDYLLSMDQPSLDGLNSYIVSKETSKSLKVALSGLGGDEIFAGYSHFDYISRFSNKKTTGISQLGKKINNIKPNKYTKNFEFYGLSPELAVEKKRSMNNNVLEIINKNLETKNKKYDSNINLTNYQRISKFELDNYLLNTLLRDSDVMGMAHSLEVRPILLDHKLVELAFSIKDEFKVKNNLHKAILIDSVKDLIPHEVWNRKKTGFSMPLANWMNNKFNNRFRELTNSTFAKELYSDDYLKKLKEEVFKSNSQPKRWIDFILLNWIGKYKINL